MKSISQVRSLIESIPEAIIKAPPEEHERSFGAAVKNLWDISENQNLESIAPIEQPDNSFTTERTLLPPEEIFEYGAEIDEYQLVEALGGGKGSGIKKDVEINGVDAPFLRHPAWHLYSHFQYFLARSKRVS